MFAWVWTMVCFEKSADSYNMSDSLLKHVKTSVNSVYNVLYNVLYDVLYFVLLYLSATP